jgi:multidrug transporter EmrE-like cation transporter
VVGLILIKQWLPAATAAWRAGVGMLTPGLMVGMGSGLYILSFMLWMVILARNELSVAYPTAIGLTLVFSTLAATFVLGEQVSIWNAIGILFIFLGIILITCY